MNRLFAAFASLTMFAVSATAQAERTAAYYAAGGYPPRLSAGLDKDGHVTVTAGPLSSSNGVLVLIGAFDDTMASLGQGLPSILVNSAIVAFTFTAGEELSVSAKWPPMQVMLQAVEASFSPFGVWASPVLRIGGAQSDADLPPVAAPATN